MRIPLITLSAPDAARPASRRGVRGIQVTTRGLGAAGLGACAPPPTHRLQSSNINKCQPYMETYNVPCTAETINCVLFRKESFEANKTRMRAHLARRPGSSASAEQQYAWMNDLCALIDATIYDTNIRPVWLFGGEFVSVDYNRSQWLDSLPPALWSRTRALLASLSIEAASDRWCSPVVAFPCGLPVYHAPESFRANVQGCVRGSGTVGAGRPGEGSRGSGGATATPVGTRGLGDRPRYFFAPVGPGALPPLGGRAHQFGAAEVNRCGFLVAMTPGARSQLRTRFPGWTPSPTADKSIPGREAAILHLRTAHGAGLIGGSFPVFARARWEAEHALVQRDRDGLDYVQIVMPRALSWMDYYVALAEDILATPFEVYVLFGLEQWAGNMQVWAVRLGLNPEEFRSVVVRARDAQARATTGIGFALLAPLFAAANPLAGIVVQALGLVAELFYAIGGTAVGGWQCPTPLTIRSAQGDCDFSQLLGPEAASRVQRQQEGVRLFFSPGQTNEEQELESESSKLTKPLLIGGALVAAGAAAYFLLKD